MGATASLWTKHRPLAARVAAGYRIPGLERQDVEQEAMVALWNAARTYNPDAGAKFTTWAERVIRARLVDVLRTATRQCRHAPLVDLGEIAAPDNEEARQRLRSIRGSAARTHSARTASGRSMPRRQLHERGPQHGERATERATQAPSGGMMRFAGLDVGARRLDLRPAPLRGVPA